MTTLVKDLDSRELDRLIAIYIMAWGDVSFLQWTDRLGGLNTSPILEGKSPDSPMKSELVPYYSSQFSDSVSLLDCILNTDDTAEVDLNLTQARSTVTIRYMSMDDNGLDIPGVVSATDSNPARAIALACLYFYFDNQELVIEDVEDPDVMEDMEAYSFD